MNNDIFNASYTNIHVAIMIQITTTFFESMKYPWLIQQGLFLFTIPPSEGWFSYIFVLLHCWFTNPSTCDTVGSFFSPQVQLSVKGRCTRLFQKTYGFILISPTLFCLFFFLFVFFNYPSHIFVFFSPGSVVIKRNSSVAENNKLHRLKSVMAVWFLCGVSCRYTPHSWWG